MDVNHTLHNNVSGRSLDPLSPMYFTLNMIITVLVYTGNIMTMIAVGRFRVLRTITNTFTVSLAVSDLLVAIALPLCSILNHTTIIVGVTARRYSCLTCKTFTTISMGSSLINLFLLAMDRYISVFYSLKYLSIMRQTRANVLVAIAWIYMSSSTIVFIWVFDTWKSGTYCALVRIVPAVLYYGFFVLNIFTFVTITIVLYAKIFYTARKQANIISIQAASVSGKCQDSNGRSYSVAQRATRKEAKVTQMMGLVLGFFLLCWIPYTVLNILRGRVTVAPRWLDIMYKLSISLLYSNSFMNPIIYGWKNRTFRSAYKRLWMCGRYDRKDLNNSLNIYSSTAQ